MAKQKGDSEGLAELISGLAKQVLPNPGILPSDQIEKPIRAGSKAVADRICEYIDPMWAGAIILGGYLLYEKSKQDTANAIAASQVQTPQMYPPQTQYAGMGCAGGGVEQDTETPVRETGGVAGGPPNGWGPDAGKGAGKTKVSYTYSQSAANRARGGR